MVDAIKALSVSPYSLRGVGETSSMTTEIVTLADPVGAAVGACVCVGAWVGLNVVVHILAPGLE